MREVSVPGGVMRVSQHRPARPATVIVDAWCGRASGPVEARRLVRLATDEGEHAVMALLRPVGGAEVALGIVYGDDFHVELVPVGFAAAEGVAALERAVRRVRLGLSAERQRPFLHAPPRGWLACAQAATDVREWRPAAPSDRTSVLRVWPARPAGGGAHEALVLELAGVAAEAAHRGLLHAFQSAHGLDGSLVRVTEGGRSVETVVLCDGGYAYPAQLVGDPRFDDDDRETLAQMIESIEPLPPRRGARPDLDGTPIWP